MRLVFVYVCVCASMVHVCDIRQMDRLCVCMRACVFLHSQTVKYFLIAKGPRPFRQG